MYSKKIEKILKEKKIEIGDRVTITKNGKKYEGSLMPRIELGDRNSVIIKLDTGYNTGFEFTTGMKIEKLKKGQKPGGVPTKTFKKNKSLPTISLIGTGGTIGTHVDYKTGGVFMCRTPEEIISTTPELENIVNIKSMLRPFTTASEDMYYKDWQKIAKITAKELNSGVDGIIITHGTDTLHFTSAALSFMLRGLNKPVSLVGAQRSPDRGSFDGSLNLICASHFSGKSDMAEVCTVMHGTINDDYCLAVRGTKSRKMNTSRRDAFRPINDEPLAKIWPNGKIKVTSKNYNKRSENEVKAEVKFEPKVALLKAYPNSDPSIIDWHVKKGFRGLVIEGMGLGHLPTGQSGVKIDKEREKVSWIPHIKKAIENGLIVVMTSQALYGRVNPLVYRNLRIVSEAGVIYGEDMLPEVALIKLGWLMGNFKDKEKVKEMMLKNIAGEISKKIEPDSFLV